MFSRVTLPGTRNNVLQQGRSGVDTGEKDFLILKIVKTGSLMYRKRSHPQSGLTRISDKH